MSAPVPARVAAAVARAVALVVAVTVVAVAGVVGVPAPAAAHDQLISSTPEDGGSLTELPTQIVLEFSNDLIDAAPALLIRDAAGTTVYRATPAVDSRVATADFPELGDGAYRLAWSVVSSDGHRIEGSMPFEMATGRPAAPLATADAAAPAPVGPTGTPSPGTPADGPDGTLSSLSMPVKVAIGIGGLGALLGALAVVIRGRRGGLRGQ